MKKVKLLMMTLMMCMITNLAFSQTKVEKNDPIKIDLNTLSFNYENNYFISTISSGYEYPSITSFSQYSNRGNKTTNYSYFQTCNIPKAPFGLAFFVHKKHIGFFAEFKFGGVRPNEEIIKTWSEKTTAIDYSYYPWNTNYGSYEYSSGTLEYRYGTADKYRLFNIGVSTTYYKTSNINMKVFLGLGICRIKRQTVQESKRFSYTAINLELVDYYDSSGDLSYTYEVIKTEYLNKLNFTGGLLFEWKGGGSLGIGVDSRALGVNLMAGFNF